MKLKHTFGKGVIMPLSLLLFCIALQTNAQSLYVLKSNNELSTFEVENVKCLSFSDGQLMITERDSSCEISLSEIRHISFSNSADNTTNLEENKSTTIQKLNCYPNPCTSDLNIDLKELEGSINIEVLSTSGQTMLSQNKVNSKDIYTLNVSGLSDGIYLLKVASEGQMTMTSFIKQ